MRMSRCWGQTSDQEDDAASPLGGVAYRWSVMVHTPVCKSHTRIVLSLAPETNRLPSNWSDHTRPVWPCSVACGPRHNPTPISRQRYERTAHEVLTRTNNNHHHDKYQTLPGHGVPDFDGVVGAAGDDAIFVVLEAHHRVRMTSEPLGALDPGLVPALVQVLPRICASFIMRPLEPRE